MTDLTQTVPTQTITVGKRVLRVEPAPASDLEGPYRLTVIEGRDAGLSFRLLRNQVTPHMMFGLAEIEPFTNQWPTRLWFSDKSGELVFSHQASR